MQQLYGELVLNSRLQYGCGKVLLHPSSPKRWSCREVKKSSVYETILLNLVLPKMLGGHFKAFH